MLKTNLCVVLICFLLIVFGSGSTQADARDTGYIGPTSTDSSDIKVPISLPKVAIPEPSSTSNNKVSTTTTSSDSSKSSTSSNKGTSAKSAKANVSAASVTAQDSTASAGGSGITPNVQAASVQVEPSSGSANLSIPIEVPPGRAGIQPNLAMEKKYDQQFKAVFEAIRRLIAYPNEAYKKTKIGYIVDPK